MGIIEEKKRLQMAKESIRQSIIAKGVNVDASFTLTDYSAKIDAIDTSQTYTFTAGASCKKIQFKSIPKMFFNGITDMTSFFADNTLLEDPTNLATVDFDKITSMPYCFERCTNIKSIPSLSLPNVLNLQQAFASCTSLEVIGDIYAPKCTQWWNVFDGSKSLISVGIVDLTSNVSAIMGRDTTPLLETIYINNAKGTIYLTAPKLKKECILYLFNNAQTVTGSGNTLYLNNTYMKPQLTSAEIAIATGKGFTVSFQ